MESRAPGIAPGLRVAAPSSRRLKRVFGKMTLPIHVELLPCARGSDVLVTVSHRGNKLVIQGRSRWKNMSFAV